MVNTKGGPGMGEMKCGRSVWFSFAHWRTGYRTSIRFAPSVAWCMSPLFDCLYAQYAQKGSHSIPSECLLRAHLPQRLYAIPSERKLCGHLEYNLLFRWFVGLPLSKGAWHPTSFTKNRDRILTADVAGIFFEKIRGEAEAKKFLSREHFSVDGTLIEAAASLKSFRPKDEGEDQDGGDIPTRGTGKNPKVDFHGERRSNKTHASRTDPEARLARKGRGKEAKLAYAGHIVVENRNGLIVDLSLIHISEPTRRTPISYAVFCLTKKTASI